MTLEIALVLPLDTRIRERPVHAADPLQPIEHLREGGGRPLVVDAPGLAPHALEVGALGGRCALRGIPRHETQLSTEVGRYGFRDCALRTDAMAENVAERRHGWRRVARKEPLRTSFRAWRHRSHAGWRTHAPIAEGGFPGAGRGAASRRARHRGETCLLGEHEDPVRCRGDGLDPRTVQAGGA